MAINFLMSHRLSEPSTPHNIGLRGVPVGDTTQSIKVEVSWRWRDDPDMEPQLFGFVTAERQLSIPFDLQDREIILFFRSFSSDGVPDVRRVQDGKQVIYGPSRVAEISSLDFDAGTPEITLNFDANGGTGDIHILRQINGGGFGEIAVVASTITSQSDIPVVDGSYEYKLTQDGQAGESAVVPLTVSGVSAGTGASPDTLAGSYDSGLELASLTWVNHGGTGLITVERKRGTGAYTAVTTLSSSTTSYDDTLIPDSRFTYAYTYRVSNATATGYSNELVIFVPHA